VSRLNLASLAVARRFASSHRSIAILLSGAGETRGRSISSQISGSDMGNPFPIAIDRLLDFQSIDFDLPWSLESDADFIASDLAQEYLNRSSVGERDDDAFVGAPGENKHPFLLRSIHQKTPPTTGGKSIAGGSLTTEQSLLMAQHSVKCKHGHAGEAGWARLRRTRRSRGLSPDSAVGLQSRGVTQRSDGNQGA